MRSKKAPDPAPAGAAAISPGSERRPAWARALRALRAARGVTQDGWAATLGVGRTTVQRWERGEAVPDAFAEQRIMVYCREQALFRPGGRQIPGGPSSAEALQDLLAAARLGAVSITPPAAASASPAGGTSTEDLLRPGMSVPLSTLIGRDELVAALRRRLTEARLLTLTGAGGVGKTRLALAVAAAAAPDFADGVRVVALASIRDPDLVGAAVARELSMRESAATPLPQGLTAAIGARRLLLLLDNFEHLLAAAPLVGELLAGCPRLTVLVTSRAPLRLDAEHQFPVPPLALPPAVDRPAIGSRRSGATDALLGARSPSRQPRRLLDYAAVRLFVERARAIRPDFALTAENAGAVAEVCARLDGLPLAIELAAARVTVLSVRTLLARLDDRLGLLTRGAHDLPDRQQTLRAAIEWSHALLDPAARALFRRLAVFAGGWALEAAETVCSGGDELGGRVLDALATLVDHSLVRCETSADAEPRFAMLETVGEYARERLEAGEEADDVRRRHVAFYLALAEGAARELRGPRQHQSLARLDGEHDNLRAALGWALDRGEGDLALRLVGALAPFWDVRSALSEARTWLARALAAGDRRPALRIPALTWAAYFACLQGDLGPAERQAEQALALAREQGSGRGAGYALLILGQVATERGDGAAAVRHWETCLTALRDAGDIWGMARPLNNLGEAARARGDYDRARALHEEALALHRRLGDTLTLPNVLSNLARVAWRQGDAPAARAAGDEALALSIEQGNMLYIAAALEVLAIALTAQAAPARAARLWGATEALRETLGAPLEVTDRADQECAVAAARLTLGADRFARLWAEGRTLTPERAIAVARRAGSRRGRTGTVKRGGMP
jgi:non-specific serine/threonine protein kinase